MTLMMLNLMIIMLLYLFSFLSIKMKKNKEKLFPFECGFNPFLSPRSPFSLQFFKILLIFLLFDLEIIMILPLPFLQIKFVINNFLVIMTLMIIIMSLYYEWKEGSLKWIK